MRDLFSKIEQPLSSSWANNNDAEYVPRSYSPSYCHFRNVREQCQWCFAYETVDQQCGTTINQILPNNQQQHILLSFPLERDETISQHDYHYANPQ